MKRPSATYYQAPADMERILQRHGIEIARSTMCDWAAQCADVLRPLYDLMIERGAGLQGDPHRRHAGGRAGPQPRTKTRTGRFWVYLGDKEHPYTVFTYTPSRSRDGPMEFLKDWGKEERVYLQADAFGGYDGIYAGEAGGQVTEVACWAHARRKFYEARNSDAAASTQALAYIRLLYDVEDQAKESAKQSHQTARSQLVRTVSPAPGTRRAAPAAVQDVAGVPAGPARRTGPAQEPDGPGDHVRLEPVGRLVRLHHRRRPGHRQQRRRERPPPRGHRPQELALLRLATTAGTPPPSCSASSPPASGTRSIRSPTCATCSPASPPPRSASSITPARPLASGPDFIDPRLIPILAAIGMPITN